MSAAPLEGWTTATINELISPEGLFTDGDWVESKDQDPEGEVRLIQLADVGDGCFRNRSSRFLRPDQAERLGCTFLKEGDVLVARMPDPLGRACIYPGLSSPAVTAVDVCIIRPANEQIDNRLLMWFLNAPQFRSEVMARQAGTTRKRISRKNLAAISLPVPPLAEQERIVAAIEERFSGLDAAQSSVQASNVRSSHLRKALLARLGAAATPVALGDVSLEARYGTSIKCSYDGPGSPVLRIPNIQQGRLNMNDMKYANDTTTDLTSYQAERGDLLFVRTNGSRDLIGRTAAVDADDRPAFASYLIRVRPDPSRLDARFAALALSSPQCREQIESKAATTAGQYNLNLKSIASLRIPVPPVEEQVQLTAEIESQLTVLDSISRTINRTLLRSESLRRSILGRAFAGCLIQRDRNDELPNALADRLAEDQAFEQPHRGGWAND
jgi:type I restriction enzyme S subunit